MCRSRSSSTAARSARRGYLNYVPEHRRVEIGWTWLQPVGVGTGANVETKLLLLEHAFERHGLRRVEFKTDARNERTRGALLALGAQFEGIFRKHMILPSGSRDSAWYAVDRRRLAAREGASCSSRVDASDARRSSSAARPSMRDVPAKGDRRARRYSGCGCRQA